MILRRLHLRLGKKAMEKLMKPVEATLEGRGVRRGGGYLEPFVLLEPPAHNPGCSCVLGLTYSSGTFVPFFVFTAGCKASGPPGPPLHPAWNPWNIQLSQGTGQGVSMTFNAASRLRSLEGRSAVRRWGQVAANCRVCIVSRNLQSCHPPLGSAA